MALVQPPITYYKYSMLIRCFYGSDDSLFDRLQGFSHCRIVAVHEIFEFLMQEISPELILLHFFECLICGPAFIGHPIQCSHNTGSMFASYAMQVDGRGISITHEP